MSVPTESEFQSCAARWRGEHEGISYELAWHGKSEYMRQGIWCWYISVNDEQFYPDDWALLRLEPQDREFVGSWRRHWSYENFPDLEPHGGWTFGEMETYLGRDGKEHQQVKVGCDYSHLWDRESGYWQDKDEIERDVKHSIGILLKMFPKRRLRCAYSGRYDDPDKFYKSRAGWWVHVDCEQKACESKHENWMRAEVVS